MPMELKRLFGITASFHASIGVGWTLFVPYLLSLGYTMLDALLFFTSMLAFTLVILSLARDWKTRDYLTIVLAGAASSFLFPAAMKLRKLG